MAPDIFYQEMCFVHVRKIKKMHKNVVLHSTDLSREGLKGHMLTRSVQTIPFDSRPDCKYRSWDRLLHSTLLSQNITLRWGKDGGKSASLELTCVPVRTGCEETGSLGSLSNSHTQQGSRSPRNSTILMNRCLLVIDWYWSVLYGTVV